MDSAHDLKIELVTPNGLLSKDLWLGHLYILAITATPGTAWRRKTGKPYNALL